MIFTQWQRPQAKPGKDKMKNVATSYLVETKMPKSLI
jgi:hypothetical protein